MNYFRELKWWPKERRDSMLLKGFNLIPIDTDVAILPDNLGTMVFVEIKKNSSVFQSYEV